MQRKMKTQGVSVLVLAILLVSMLAFVPHSAVAATPTIALSPAAGTYADCITITGTGFPSGQDDIALYLKIATKTVAVEGATTISMFSQSIWVSGVTDSGKVKADANGFFKALFYPAGTNRLPGGVYNAFCEYTPTAGSPTLTAAVSFTVKSYVDVRLSYASSAVKPTTRSGFYGQEVRVRARGFGETETVKLSGLPLAVGEGTTNVYGDVSDFYTTLGNATGGSKTVTATGEDSGLSATATFTINPVIGVYALSTDTSVTLSTTGTAPVTVFLGGFGFGYEEEISANSIKVGGVSTIHSKITADRKGTWGFVGAGGGTHVAITCITSLPVGLNNVTIGTRTFSFEAGNIMPASGIVAARKGALIVSSDSAGGTATALVLIDKEKYQVGGRVWMFGINFDKDAAAATATYDGGSITWGARHPSTSPYVDTNGAFAWYFSTPSSKFGAHALQASQASLVIPEVVVGVIPELKLYTDSIVDAGHGYAYFGTSLWLSGTGFNGTETLYITIGVTRITTTITPDATYGSFSATSIGTLPDIAKGTHTVVATGTTTDNKAEAFSYERYDTLGSKIYGVNVLSKAFASSLTVASGRAGDTITLQTTTTAGIHGLKASTKYDVYWGADSAVVTSFTSTAKGGIPPGVQFRAPAAVTGYHIIDIREAGVSALWGLQLESYVKEIDHSEFENLLFSMLGKFTAAPTVGSVGTNVTISGAGLAPNAAHYVKFAGVIYATFTSTATGEIPAGTTFAFPEAAVTAGEELGSSKDIIVEDADGVQIGIATFILQASATLDKKIAKIGDTVTITAYGLAASQVYNVIFDWVLPAEGAWTGSIVSAFASTSLGSGSAVFTVPSDAIPGRTVTIMLLKPTDTLRERRVAMPPTLTVEAVAPPVLPGTATFTPSAPKLLDSAGREVTSVPKATAFYVQISLKNNVASDLSVYVIVQIKDAKGTVVAIGLTAADIKALTTKNVPVAFIGIATPGTYSATIFVWSSITEPMALATPTTFSFTVV